LIDEFLDFIGNKVIRINTISSGTGRIDIWKTLLSFNFKSYPFGFSDNYIYMHLEELGFKYSSAFLNNSGRAHNMFLQILISYGYIGFLIFSICMIKTILQIVLNYKYIKNENKIIFSLFLVQFIVILVGGFFEQLPIFSMSAHSLIFMLVWVNLLTITENYN
jgi:O-antigen ligase